MPIITFQQRSLLTIVAPSEDEDQNILQTLCKLTSIYLPNIYLHLIIKIVLRLYQTKREVGQNGLKNQILIYTCDICEQDFNRIQNLRSHFSATHSKSPNKNSLNCNVRPNPFQSRDKSTFHIDTYHGKQKSHKCDACDKSFSHACLLKKHINIIHEGRKDYKCDSCDKSFSQAGHLKNHIITIHEGCKDFECKSCDKSFSEAGSLRRHINTIH